VDIELQQTYLLLFHSNIVSTARPKAIIS